MIKVTGYQVNIQLKKKLSDKIYFYKYFAWFQGPATVLVSCIEADKPYRTHPYNLNGRHCKKGICRVDVSSKTDMTAVFSKIAIESVKKQDIPQSLAKRQELSIDPFGQGFDTMKSKTDIASIELNQIRLCFQVFIPGDQSQYVAGPIAVSNVIKDKRIHEDLSIINISENYATVNGGKKILLFTSKICKDDIQVRFSCNYSKLLQNFIILDIPSLNPNLFFR